MCFADVASSGGNGLLSLQCALPTMDAVPRSILQTFVGVIFPFVVALFFIVLWAFMTVLKRKSCFYLLHHWHAAIVSVIYFFYINMTRILLRIFTCTDVDDEGDDFTIATSKYWVEDPDLKCYEGIHLGLVIGVGIPLLLLISFGMPLGLLAIFTWHRKSLVNGRFFQSYGFLYSSYRVEYQYWEVLIMLRKALMAAVAVFAFSLGPDLQASLASGILVISFGIHLLKMPFVLEGPNLNRLESVSLFCSYIVFFTALIFNDPNSSPTGKMIVSLLLIGSLMGVTIYFVLALMREISKGIDMKLEENGVEIPENATKLWKFVLLLDFGVARLLAMAREWIGWILETVQRSNN